MEDRTITKHYFISGRVQGVGFRAFVRRVASEMKLQGWVRNLNDGRVEALIHGAESVVEKCTTLLRKGPPHGQVDKLEEGPVVNENLAADFEIRKDGR